MTVYYTLSNTGIWHHTIFHSRNQAVQKFACKYFTYKNLLAIYNINIHIICP